MDLLCRSIRAKLGTAAAPLSFLAEQEWGQSPIHQNVTVTDPEGQTPCRADFLCIKFDPFRKLRVSSRRHASNVRSPHAIIPSLHRTRRFLGSNLRSNFMANAASRIRCANGSVPSSKAY